MNLRGVSCQTLVRVPGVILGRSSQETRLHIPYAGIGILALLIIGSMIAVYCVDPSGIVEKTEENPTANDRSDKTLEIVLMSLLFVYLFVCCNGECTFSSQYHEG